MHCNVKSRFVERNLRILHEISIKLRQCAGACFCRSIGINFSGFQAPSLKEIAGHRAFVSSVLITEICFQTLFFRPYLKCQKCDLDGKDDQRPPALDPHQYADIVDVYSQQHRITGKTVWPVRHQVPGPGRDFVVIGIKRIAFADLFHMHDRPYTQRQAKNYQNGGNNRPRQRRCPRERLP